MAHLGAFAGAATVSTQRGAASVVRHEREQVIVVVHLGGPEQWRSRNSAPLTLIRRDRRHLLGGEHDLGRSTGLFGGRQTASRVRDSPSGDDTTGMARSTLRSWSAPTVHDSSEARTVHRVTILTDRSMRFSREANDELPRPGFGQVGGGPDTTSTTRPRSRRRFRPHREVRVPSGKSGSLERTLRSPTGAWSER